MKLLKKTIANLLKIAIGIALLSVALGRAHPQSANQQTIRKTTQHNQKSNQYKQQANDKLPLTSDPKPANPNNSQNNTTPDDDTRQLIVIGYIQSFIFALQAGIFCWQGWWMRKTVTEMQKATEESREATDVARVANEHAKAANDILRDSIQETDRAYVSLESVQTEITPDGVVIRPVWRNTGHTPTKQMMCNTITGLTHIGGQPWRDVDNDQANWATCFIGPNASAPGREVVVYYYEIEQVVMSTPQLCILVWGWADYNDVFKDTERHRTEFCCKVILNEHIATAKLDRMQKGLADNWLELAQSIKPFVTCRIRNDYSGADQECHHKPGEYHPPTF